MTDWSVHHGDCIEVLRTLPDCSVDAVVTDPPYGLSFMGRKWDYDVPGVEVWAECLRVLKPGGHLLAFAGTRTQHRMCCRIEDAGFEIRDMIAWVYGSGFPKSLDVSKAIDSRKDWASLKLMQVKVRAAREAMGISQSETARRMGLIAEGDVLGGGGFMWFETGMRVPTPEQYSKLKAALGLDDTCDDAFKAAEREIVGQKEMCDTTKARAGFTGPAHSPDYDGSKRMVNITTPSTEAAKQWHGWGTALKPALEPITVARKPLCGTVAANVLEWGTGAINVDGCRVGEPIAHQPGGLHRGSGTTVGSFAGTTEFNKPPAGRWPANLIHDGSEEATAGMGECSRYFYCPKASKADRDEGCDGMAVRRGGSLNMRTDGHSQANGMDTGPRANHHPTVKPTALMRYLCRLVTPPGGTVLDPFTGSGSTGKSAALEGFRFIGIEREAEYVEIARARIAATQPPLMAGVHDG